MATDPLDHAAALFELAHTARAEGDLTGAHAHATRALALFRKHAGPEHPDAGNTLALLGCIRRDQSGPGAALPLLRRAVRVLSLHRRHEAVRPMFQQALVHLGGALRDAGRYPESLKVLRRAVTLGRGLDDDLLIGALNDYGMTCKYAGLYAKGAAAYSDALARLEARAAPDPAVLATLLHNIGGIEHARGRVEHAEAPARRGLALRIAAFGEDHPDVALDRGALAAIVADRGDFREAETIYRTLLARASRVRDRGEQAVLCHNLGALLARTDRPKEALRVIRRAVALGQETLGKHHPDLVLTLYNLGAVLVTLGRANDARAVFTQAVALGRKTLGARHPTTVASAKALQA